MQVNVRSQVHSKSVDLQVSVSTEAPALEEYKHSASDNEVVLMGLNVMIA